MGLAAPISIALLVLAGCIFSPVSLLGTLPQPSVDSSLAAAEAATATPEAATPTPEPATPTAEAAASSGGGGGLLETVFPAGNQALVDQVLLSCGNCHSWVCAVIDQRPEEHWQTVKENHRDRLSNLSDDELDQLFTFLMENFGPDQPEPELPPALQEMGCTTQG